MTDDLDAFYEALLFIAERPLETDELAELAEVPRTQAEAALSALAERLDEDGRGLRVQHNDGAWQLVTAPEVGARLAAYAAREEARLSPAALEALAVVAYRQPCTRATSSGSAASTPTTSSGRCSIGGWSSSWGGATRPAARCCSGRRSRSSSASG